MTYFGFLAIFLGIPIILLTIWHIWDVKNGRKITAVFSAVPAKWALLIHIIVALVYTTPWDNYLVATRVWWYDPNLVTGIVLGWVPIEEYTFFIVQPIMTGLWLLSLARYPRFVFRSQTNQRAENRFHKGAFILLTLVWVGITAVYLLKWQPATYLALELIWAIPPILLQLWFGGHILWRYRRFVALAIIPTTLYLSFADALAIQAGTWTINPAQSLNWFIGGVLPIEEFLFFLLTNTLISFGMTLMLAQASQVRIAQLKEILFSKNNRSATHDNKSHSLNQ